MRTLVELIENLNFGKTRFNSCVFEKHFISYSCILFLKFNALRNFYIKLLCFSNLWFFQNFDWSNLFFDRLKFRLKFWSAFVCFDRSSIANGSIEAFFIDRIYFSINRKSRWEFFKNFCFHAVSIISNFFKPLFSLIRSVKSTKAIFCRFPPKILQGFSPLRLVRPFYPSFCIYFHVSCIKSCNFGKISNQWIFGIFDDSSCFS